MSGSCGGSLPTRCEKQARASPKRKGGARSLTRRNQPAWSADRATLAERPDREGWRKLDGSQRWQVYPGLTEQQVARARRSSRKCKTKPMEIGRKPFSFKELRPMGSTLFMQNEPNSGSRNLEWGMANGRWPMAHGGWRVRVETGAGRETRSPSCHWEFDERQDWNLVPRGERTR